MSENLRRMMQMNLDNVEIYGAGARETIPGFGANGLVRIPATVRNQLNERARFIGRDSVGIEVRFVTDAPNIDLYLTRQQAEFKQSGSIRIFRGNFLYETVEIESGVASVCRIVANEEFDQVNDGLTYQEGYSPKVWRIVCDRGVIVLNGINTFGHDIRPPKQEELPKLDWLAYGSSITNSSLDGYPHFAAAKLRVQVQNKGFSGACHIEKVLVDYMLDECRFDFITCELGVNMRKVYTPEEFEKRASYLVGRLARLGKPALIITTFPNRDTQIYTKEVDSITTNENAFNEILVRLVKEVDCPTVQLVHGYEILTDINGLSGDLLHPTIYGHAIMGNNLADRLKVFLKECNLLK